MIKPTKRKLIILFTAIIIFFNAVVMMISFMTLNRSLLNSIKDHLARDVNEEYLPLVTSRNFNALENLHEHEIFQVFTRDGKMVSGTYKFSSFTFPVDQHRLNDAFAGKQEYQRADIDGSSYLILYITIDDTYAGRVAMPLTALMGYEKNFIRLVIIFMPVMLLFTIFVSWLLVDLAMKPISDVFRFQQNFSSNVTHELRTPLASLMGNLEVALRKSRSSEEYRETLLVGLKEVKRLIALLNNLYMLANSKFRPLDLMKQKADLKTIIEETVLKYKAELTSKNIELDDSGLEDIYCRCDESLMRRAIENLLDNAVKYTPTGGRIVLRLTGDGSTYTFSVSNTCGELDRNEIKNFFEPFYRGEAARSQNTEGKGLGLYIARYILRSHGGDIKVETVQDGMCTLEMTGGEK